MDPVDPYRGGMRALRLFLATLVSALLALPLMLTGAGVAHAEDETPSSWRIARYDVDARIQTNGDALVTARSTSTSPTTRGTVPSWSSSPGCRSTATGTTGA